MVPNNISPIGLWKMYVLEMVRANALFSTWGLIFLFQKRTGGLLPSVLNEKRGQIYFSLALDGEMSLLIKEK